MIAADPKVEVRAIPAPTGGSRAFCDRMNSAQQQAAILAMSSGDGQGAGPIAKNLVPSAPMQSKRYWV
jgi:aspartyl-tRNA synthetase